MLAYPLQIATKYLTFNGTFITKMFMGELFEDFHKEMKTFFTKVKLHRPESTRKGSKEIFFVGRGIK